MAVGALWLVGGCAFISGEALPDASSTGVGLTSDASPQVDVPVDAGPDTAPSTSDAGPPPCVGGVRQAVLGATGHCYMTFLVDRSYADAQQACAALGGHLAVSSSQAENNLINSIKPTIDEAGGQVGAWLGGDDLAAEGSFTWLTGEPFSFTYWRNGAPNDDAGGGVPEDCITMDLDNDGPWNDRACDALIPYICERP